VVSGDVFFIEMRAKIFELAKSPIHLFPIPSFLPFLPLPFPFSPFRSERLKVKEVYGCLGEAHPPQSLLNTARGSEERWKLFQWGLERSPRGKL